MRLTRNKILSLVCMGTGMGLGLTAILIINATPGPNYPGDWFRWVFGSLFALLAIYFIRKAFNLLNR